MYIYLDVIVLILLICIVVKPSVESEFEQTLYVNPGNVPEPLTPDLSRPLQEAGSNVPEVVAEINIPKVVAQLSAPVQLLNPQGT